MPSHAKLCHNCIGEAIREPFSGHIHGRNDLSMQRALYHRFHHRASGIFATLFRNRLFEHFYIIRILSLHHRNKRRMLIAVDMHLKICNLVIFVIKHPDLVHPQILFLVHDIIHKALPAVNYHRTVFTDTKFFQCLITLADKPEIPVFCRNDQTPYHSFRVLAPRKGQYFLKIRRQYVDRVALHSGGKDRLAFNNFF